MKLSRYEDYRSALTAGRKDEARNAVAEFVGSFADDAERAAWTDTFFATHVYGDPVRHELYVGIILPVLRTGADRGDATSLYRLAATAANHASDRRLAEGLGYRAELGLLKDAFAAAPDRADIRRALLAALMSSFTYAAHEWPAGLLAGMDGGSLADCEGYLDDIGLARRLDVEGHMTAGIDDFERNVKLYRMRLSATD